MSSGRLSAHARASIHAYACMRKKGNLRNQYVKDCGVECKTLVSQAKNYVQQPRQAIDPQARGPARKQSHSAT